MTEALVKQDVPGWLVPSSMQDAWAVAQRIAKSGIGSKSIQNNPEAALMVMAHGATLGYSHIESVQVFHVIPGKGGSKITMEATAQRARAMSHPGCKRFDIEATDTKATVLMEWEGWDEPKTLEVTIEEAERARWGMLKGTTRWDAQSSWMKTPSDMLAARATTRAIRRWVPFALGQTVMYSPEEILEVEPEKNISPEVSYVEAEEVTEPIEAEAATNEGGGESSVTPSSDSEESTRGAHAHDGEGDEADKGEVVPDDDLELIMEDDEEPPVNRQEILAKLKEGCKYFHGGNQDKAARLYRAIFSKRKKHPEKCDHEVLIEVLSALEEASLQGLSEEQLMESI